MDKPTLSVIIAAYNPDSTLLADVLESILMQDYTDYEVLIVDDGSCEDAAMAIDAVAARDNRIRVLHVEHHGVSVARNIGMEHARGEFFTFVDADDRLCAGFFSSAVEELIRTGADIAFGWTRHVVKSVAEKDPVPYDGKTTVIQDAEMEDFRSFALSGLSRPSLQGMDSLNLFPISAKVFRSSSLASLRMDSELTLGEDSLFNTRAVFLARSVVVVRSPWYEYHKRMGSATNGRPDEMLAKIKDIERFRMLAEFEGWDSIDIALHCATYIVQVFNSVAPNLTLRELACSADRYIGSSLRSCVSLASTRGRLGSRKRQFALWVVATSNPSVIALFFKANSLRKGKRVFGRRISDE